MKRITLTALFLAVTLGTGQAYGFALSNPSMLAQKIKENMDVMANHLEKMAMEEMGLEQFSENSEKKINALKNTTANWVARDTDTQTGIWHKTLQGMNMASEFLCNDVSVIELGDNLTCIEQSEAGSAQNELSESRMSYFEGGSDHTERGERMAEIIDRIERQRPDLFGHDGDASESDNGATASEAGESEAISDAFSLNAQPLMASGSTMLSLNAQEYDAMKDMINLIVPTPDVLHANQAFEDMRVDDQAITLQMDVLREMSRSSLMQTLALRASGAALSEGSGLGDANTANNPTSTLYGFQEAVDSGASMEGIESISSGDAATPTVLYRIQTQRMAQRLDMQLKTFQSQLRKEAQTAAQLIQLMEKGPASPMMTTTLN